MADAFSYYQDPATTETEVFVRYIDRLFDCLNVRNHCEWQQKRKEDLKPYTSPDDSRLKVHDVMYNIHCTVYMMCACTTLHAWV